MGVGVTLHPDGIFRARYNLVTDIGLENQILLRAAALDIDIHRHERRVVYGDSNLFDGCDKVIPVTLAAQDARKQLDQAEPVDRAALVVPCSVAGDADIQITAIGRVPLMNGRQTLALRRPDRGCDTFR